MSAGICVMNKNAIAMAADSAVTVGQHIAIHNSVNKLFALSRYEPVGVIIYANAEFMQVPMEIIIKQYKNQLGQKNFRTLHEYVDDFIRYIEENAALFRFSFNEKTYVESVCINLLNGMSTDCQNRINAQLPATNDESFANKLKEIHKIAYDSTINFLNSLFKIPNTSFKDYITQKYSMDIYYYIKNNFNWLTDEQVNELSSRICSLYDCDFFRNGFVGMAFAGYGTDEIFPQMYHLHIEGVINGKVRYIEREKISIQENNLAAIMPLAQTDVMQTFMYGIDNNFINMIKEIPNEINRCMQSIGESNFNDGMKDYVIETLNSSVTNIINGILKTSQLNYNIPIIQSIATLPIEELSMFAESMINITSVRRQVAFDVNIGTVGGPIDSAVITKNDGFIWIKRKHYFDIKYNPQYLYSHYEHGNFQNKIDNNDITND